MNEALIAPSKETSNVQIHSYKIRWVILVQYALFSAMIGVVATSFGPINDILVRYFHAGAWTIDVLTTGKYLEDIVLLVPTSVLAHRLRYRNTWIFQQGLYVIGLCFTVAGLNFVQGYAAVLCGQLAIGAAAMIAPPLVIKTAAVWFPDDEVSLVVALLSVAKLAGKAMGVLATPLLVHIELSARKVQQNLSIYFGAIMGLLVVNLISVVACLKDAPPLPPSHAQNNVHNFTSSSENETVKEASIRFLKLFWKLFVDREFLIVTAAKVCVASSLVYDLALLSSVLLLGFPRAENTDNTAGIVLMASYVACTAGGFAVGFIMKKFGRYKIICVLSSLLCCLCRISMIVGLGLNVILATEVGLITQGFFAGVAAPAFYELIREITYPKPGLQVMLLVVAMEGVFKFAHTSVGRVLLQRTAVSVSVAYPFALHRSKRSTYNMKTGIGSIIDATEK